MSKLTYLGAVLQERTGYSILFLDAPGCASCGDTLAETLAMGKEALEGWLEVAADFGDSIPEPTEHTVADVESRLFDGEPLETGQNWVGLYPVEVDAPTARNTVSVRIRADLVERIAEASRDTARQIDSRRFIEEAVEHEIERLRKSA